LGTLLLRLSAPQDDIKVAGRAELAAAEDRRPRRVERKAREPPEQHVDRDPDLRAGERVPRAEMPPGAEGEVGLPRPEDIEAIRVGEPTLTCFSCDVAQAGWLPGRLTGTVRRSRPGSYDQ
jgi:hypothetical protein